MDVGRAWRADVLSDGLPSNVSPNTSDDFPSCRGNRGDLPRDPDQRVWRDREGRAATVPVDHGYAGDSRQRDRQEVDGASCKRPWQYLECQQVYSDTLAEAIAGRVDGGIEKGPSRWRLARSSSLPIHDERGPAVKIDKVQYQVDRKDAKKVPYIAVILFERAKTDDGKTAGRLRRGGWPSTRRALIWKPQPGPRADDGIGSGTTSPGPRKGDGNDQEDTITAGG